MKWYQKIWVSLGLLYDLTMLLVCLANCVACIWAFFIPEVPNDFSLIGKTVIVLGATIFVYWIYFTHILRIRIKRNNNV